jgi:hypothetical protein
MGEREKPPLILGRTFFKTVGATIDVGKGVSVLDRQTYQGGTRGSRLCIGGSWSGDRELEGMLKDT